MINPFDNQNMDTKIYYLACQQFIDYATEMSDPDGKPNSGDEKHKTQKEIDKMKSNYISQQLQSVEQYDYEFQGNLAKRQALIESLDDYMLKANADGFVHLTGGISEGTVIQAGTLLGSIGNAGDSLYFDTSINATDRSKVKIGDSVDISLGGVLQSEFGLLKGEIIAIDNDSIQTEKGEVFYRIKVKTASNKLTNKKGKTIYLSLGMVAECRIKYDETTWLKWIIEQIGVKLR